MKRKIIFLLFLCCSALFPAVSKNSQSIDGPKKRNMISDTVPDQYAVHFVEDFYKAYTASFLSDSHSGGLDDMEKYLTKRLIEKIARLRTATGADPIIRAQDFNENAFETLKVDPLGNNWYMVNYKWNKNDEGNGTNIPLKVILADGRYMIDYITPEWSGSLYGDTLLCEEMPRHSIDNSSPQSMLETFYAAYASLYGSMPEGAIPQLEALRAEHLSSNALSQFNEAAAHIFELDRVRNYDLLIDGFDFDCLWISSMTFNRLSEKTFQVSYKQGDLVTTVVVTLIIHEGKYKINAIHAGKTGNNEDNSTFSYYDPTFNKYDTIAANPVLYGIGISGCNN